MLTPFSTDQSPLTFSLVTIKEENIVNGLWNFNKFLTVNSDFITKIKLHINLVQIRQIRKVLLMMKTSEIWMQTIFCTIFWRTG